jgi:UDP-N-acetylmuramate: L-alanyl-gamma-D-glutamyl-meso-diaminopimelate ligase
MNSLLKRKKIHLIAIGGAVMHNLAIALQRQGNEVSGSDDEIYEPSRSRLLGEGLLRVGILNGSQSI